MGISAGNRAVPIFVPWHAGDPSAPVPSQAPSLTDPRAIASKCPPELFLALKQAWEKARWRGAGAAPLPFCPEYVIGAHTWPHASTSHRRKILSALRRVSPTLDIIYDPATAAGGSPAYHLYTRHRGAYRGSDLLIYEYSLQREFGAPWPKGTPVVPTLDIIPRIAATLKRNQFAGTAADIHRQVMAEKLSRAHATQCAIARRDAALSQFVYTDIMRPYFQRGRVMSLVPGLKGGA